MKTAACYIRVSTDDQLEYSPDAQLREIKKYAANHDILLKDNFIFTDEGISGRKTENRSAFNTMIGVAKTKPKPFDVILLWKFSRFARNREDAIVYKSMLRKLDIEVISITESIGDDKMSILVEAMIEAMDEYYSINLGEEVIRGMTQKALTGGVQTAPPLGYDKPPNSPCFVVNPSEAEYIRLIFHDYLHSNLSLLGIARKLNALGARTKRGNSIDARQVEYILNNPVYKGCLRWTPEKTVAKRIFDSPHTIIRRGEHQPIIDEKIWEQAQRKYRQAKAERPKYAKPSENKKHWLSGFLYCGSCGARLTYCSARGAFQCHKYSKGLCQTSCYISAAEIEKQLFAALYQLLQFNLQYQASAPKPEPTHQEPQIFKEIQSCEKMLQKAKAAYLAGIDTLEEYAAEKADLTRRLRLLRQALPQNQTPQQPSAPAKATAKYFLELLQSDTASTAKHNALKAILQDITCTKQPHKKLIIRFRI